MVSDAQAHMDRPIEGEKNKNKKNRSKQKEILKQ